MYLIPCGVDSKRLANAFCNLLRISLESLFASLVNCANVFCKLSWSGVQFVALILKVCKCVLQLVENLAFMPCVHLASICNWVVVESQFVLFSGLSVVPECTARNYRRTVVPVVLWRYYRWSFGVPNVSANREVQRRGPKVSVNLSRPRGQSYRVCWSGRNVFAVVPDLCCGTTASR